MILKKSILILLVIGLFGFTNSLWAAELKIGVVNVSQILKEAPQAKALSKSLETEFKRRSQDLTSKQKQLKKLEEKLGRDSEIMSEAEVKRLETDIRSRRRKLKAALDEFREDLNLRRNEELNKLSRVVTEVIHQIGEDEKIDLILENPIYASARINLTEKVLKRLKAQTKSSRK